nr:hypothetical protein [uncultured Desulfobacter sp.]
MNDRIGIGLPVTEEPPPTPGIRIAYQGGSADVRNQFPGRYNPFSIKYSTGMTMATHSKSG